VELDSATRCNPEEKLSSVYAPLLNRQGDITRRLHAGGLL
jgi:hypothetical protein